MCQIRFHNHIKNNRHNYISVYINLHILVQPTVRQKILDQMVAGLPHI
jgi:hypothetical protein